MNKLITIGVMIGALAVALSAQAAKPTIMETAENCRSVYPPVPNAINGVVFFPLEGAVENYIIQHEVDGTWETVRDLKAVYHAAVGINYIQTTRPFTYRGVSRWRVAFANPAPETDDDWLVVTIDARNPLSGTLMGTAGYNGDENGSGAHNAFDGDLSSMYHSADADRFASWVGLDLGEAKYLNRVAFVPRHEWSIGIYANNRVGEAQFQVANSPDFSDAQTFHTVKLEDTYRSAYFYSFDCDRVAYGRYVRCLSPMDYLNAVEVEFSEVAESEVPSDTDAVRISFWREPFTMNGYLYLPTFNSLEGYLLQYYDESASEWKTFSRFKETPIAKDGEQYYVSEDDSFRDGVVKFRYGYITIANQPPMLWNEFSVDTRNPVSLDDMTVWATCEWREFDANRGKYGQTFTNSFDGDFETTFHPSDAQTELYTQSVCADLGEEKPVYALTLAPLPNYRAGNQRLRYSYVEVADNPDFENATRVYTMNDSESYGNEKFYVFEFEHIYTTRYIRLVYGNTDWFNPAEIEFNLAHPASSSPRLKVEVADYDTYYPRLRFAKAYGEDGKVAIYRSNLATGPWTQVGEVDTGVGTWVETDEKMKYGRDYFYKVGSDVVSFRRLRRLSADPSATFFVNYNGCEGMLQESEESHRIECLFDGNASGDNNYPWIIATEVVTNEVTYEITDPETSEVTTGKSNVVTTVSYNVNVAAGFDFGTKRAYAAMCRVMPSPSTQAGYNIILCGTDDKSDVLTNPKTLTLPAFWPYMNAAEWKLFPCDSVEPHRYLYLYQPTVSSYTPVGSGAWSGSYREAQIYGWYDTDLVTPGMIIVIR